MPMKWLQIPAAALILSGTAGVKQRGGTVRESGGWAAQRYGGDDHDSNARAVSAAHASASRRSASVIAGRSQNTIRDTRFLVPVTERS